MSQTDVSHVSTADFLLSCFEFATNRRRFKGGDGELSTVLNPGTEEEEEEGDEEEEEEYEKDWSSTRGLLYVINRLPKRRVWGRSSERTAAVDATPKRAAVISHVCHHIKQGWITTHNGYVTVKRDAARPGNACNSAHGLLYLIRVKGTTHETPKYESDSGAPHPVTFSLSKGLNREHKLELPRSLVDLVDSRSNVAPCGRSITQLHGGIPVNKAG